MYEPLEALKAPLDVFNLKPLLTKSTKGSKDVFSVLNEAEEGLFKITEGNIKKSYSSVKDAVAEAIEEIQKELDHYKYMNQGLLKKWKNLNFHQQFQNIYNQSPF